MKKLLFIALLLMSTTALAQTTPVVGKGTAATSGAPQNAQKFAEKKAQMSQRIAQRISEMQQRQSCIQGAANGEALKACFPDRGEHKGHKNGCGNEGQ